MPLVCGQLGGGIVGATVVVGFNVVDEVVLGSVVVVVGCAVVVSIVVGWLAVVIA